MDLRTTFAIELSRLVRTGQVDLFSINAVEEIWNIIRQTNRELVTDAGPSEEVLETLVSVLNRELVFANYEARSDVLKLKLKHKMIDPPPLKEMDMYIAGLKCTIRVFQDSGGKRDGDAARRLESLQRKLEEVQAEIVGVAKAREKIQKVGEACMKPEGAW